MIGHVHRAGNFTSSEIVALTKMGTREMTEEELSEHKRLNPKSRKKNIECWPGDAAITYILETNMERQLGRSVDDESKAKALVWGSVLEQYSFDKLPMEYILSSTQTDVHPTIDYWSGSKDGVKYNKEVEEFDTVVDLKNPLTLKSFCQLVQPLYDGLTGMEAMNAIRNGYTDSRGFEHPKHKDGEKFYCQLLSNACINDKRFAELIIHMPYKDELPEIKKLVDGIPEAYWIGYADESELPHLLREGIYKDINIIRFEVPQSDKDLLTEYVLKAGKMLVPRLSVITAHHDNVGATIIQ